MDTRKDVTLELGSTTETVSVTDTAPLLKTESGEMSHQVEIEDGGSASRAHHIGRDIVIGPTARWAKSGTPCRLPSCFPA